MATGAADANGIWIYGEDDNESTHSALLNKLGNSVSTTVTRLEEMSGLTAAQLTTHRDNIGVGLVNVVPTSVAQAGGSASANAQGLVTFTGVTSVSLNGVFTSAYTDYRVLISTPTATAQANINFRIRASGSDTTTSTYIQNLFMSRVNGALATNSGSNWASWVLYYVSAEANARFEWSGDIKNPALAKQTVLTGIGSGNDATSAFQVLSGGFTATSPTHDGFTIYPSSGSVTGTVQVFGYNN